MEDAHTAVVGISDQNDTISWFAVYDGHGGKLVSQHASLHLLDCIRAQEGFMESIQQEHTMTTDDFLANITKAILSGFLIMDEKLREIPELVSPEDHSGSTAVCALVTEKYVIIANLGDSRAVCCVGGKPALVSIDHKPSNDKERQRIVKAGGSVTAATRPGRFIPRVNGHLSVSRSLGDFYLKNVKGKGPTEQPVSPAPEFFVKPVLPDDQFLILACDGVWDVLSNDDICEFVSARMRVHENLETVTNEVVDICLQRGSTDNISVIIIAFPNAPKPDPAAILLQPHQHQEQVMEVWQEFELEVIEQDFWEEGNTEAIELVADDLQQIQPLQEQPPPLPQRLRERSQPPVDYRETFYCEYQCGFYTKVLATIGNHVKRKHGAP